jgi:hypothetical protein
MSQRGSSRRAHVRGSATQKSPANTEVDEALTRPVIQGSESSDDSVTHPEESATHPVIQGSESSDDSVTQLKKAGISVGSVHPSDVVPAAPAINTKGPQLSLVRSPSGQEILIVDGVARELSLPVSSRYRCLHRHVDPFLVGGV